MTQQSLNRRLTLTDASFLYLEKPDQPSTSAAAWSTKGTSPGETCRHPRDRLHLMPRYRQKVVFPPFGMAHPTWEDDPDFDIGTTSPSDAARPRRRPRARRGRRPIYARMPTATARFGRWSSSTAGPRRHGRHLEDPPLRWWTASPWSTCLALHDLKPDAAPPPRRRRRGSRVAARPAHAAAGRRAGPARRGGPALDGASLPPLRPSRADARARSSGRRSRLPSVLRRAVMPFNGPLSPERRFAWAEFSFADIRAIRSALGGTINDVVLDIVSGRARPLPAPHGDPPRAWSSGRCAGEHAPARGARALGNHVSVMMAPLYVASRPGERLTAERAAMERLKAEGQAGDLYRCQREERYPGRLAGAAVAVIGPHTWSIPPRPMCRGRRSPSSGRPAADRLVPGRRLLASEIGLFNAILSYDRRLTFGLTFDPALIADGWEIADHLRHGICRAAERRRGGGAARGLRGGRGTRGRRPRGRGDRRAIGRCPLPTPRARAAPTRAPSRSTAAPPSPCAS